MPSFDGPLEENSILSGAAKLFDGLIQGPESIVQHKGIKRHADLEDAVPESGDTRFPSHACITCGMLCSGGQTGRQTGTRTQADACTHSAHQTLILWTHHLILFSLVRISS